MTPWVFVRKYQNIFSWIPRRISYRVKTQREAPTYAVSQTPNKLPPGGYAAYTKIVQLRQLSKYPCLLLKAGTAKTVSERQIVRGLPEKKVQDKTDPILTIEALAIHGGTPNGFAPAVRLLLKQNKKTIILQHPFPSASTTHTNTRIHTHNPPGNTHFLSPPAGAPFDSEP